MARFPPSPYRPGMGLDPPYLGDREQQLERFRGFLEQPSSPRNVVVTGLRGVGKTVLINHYTTEAEGSGWVVVAREFSEADALPDIFARTILADLTRLTRQLSMSARVKSAASKVAEGVLDTLGTLSVSYGEFQVGVTTDRRTPPPSRFDDDLRQALTEVADLCSRSEHPGFVLRYDEFHVIREKRGWLTLSALLSSVAAVQQRGLPVMLILCGLPPMVENLAHSKSYTERMFHAENLANLRPPEDRAAFIDPAVRLGRRYEEAVVDGVIQDTEGYPFFIQVYGDLLWRGSATKTISIRDFERLRPEILRTLDRGFFEARYLRAAPEERKLLRVIAQEGESSSLEHLQRVTGRRNNQLQPILAAVTAKGLLYRSGRGQVAFTAPMFGAFLRRRSEA